MLGRLVRNTDARGFAELARPHAGTVHDELGTDVPVGRTHTRCAPAFAKNVEHGYAFTDTHAAHACALGQRHRHVYRVYAAVIRHIEATGDIVHLGQWEQLAHFARGDFMDVYAAVAIERGNTPKLFEPVRIRGYFDEADGCKASRLARLGLETRIQLFGVLADFRRRFRQRPIRDHQSGGMPSGPRSEAVAFEQHHVAAAHGRQMVGHRSADDTTADNDNAGLARQHGSGHVGTPAGRRTILRATSRGISAAHGLVSDHRSQRLEVRNDRGFVDHPHPAENRPAFRRQRRLVTLQRFTGDTQCLWKPLDDDTQQPARNRASQGT